MSTEIIVDFEVRRRRRRSVRKKYARILLVNREDLFWFNGQLYIKGTRGISQLVGDAPTIQKVSGGAGKNTKFTTTSLGRW